MKFKKGFCGTRDDPKVCKNAALSGHLSLYSHREMVTDVVIHVDLIV